MIASPVLMVGLDGFEVEIANRMLGEGKLPALRRLTDRGSTILLDHGTARRTGLAWEHVSTGLSPADSGRWGAVDFDPQTYQATQASTKLRPLFAQLDVSTVVFDAPYFDLTKAKSVRGLVSWGAHDPGVEPSSRPASLAGELAARFGDYPATPWIYGFVWHSVEQTEQMSAALVKALEVRSEATQWLLGERLPAWDVGLVVISEYHSAVEAFWHGVDRDHPLHSLPSAEPARRGLEGVYEAGDRMLGGLMDRFPNARIVAFNLHGMGPNEADVPSMLLLPELLYRNHFKKPYFREREWPTTEEGVPLLSEGESWHEAIAGCFPSSQNAEKRLLQRIGGKIGRLFGATGTQESSLDWMPAARYKHFWRDMPAFALPAYYDGRVRLNLADRERHGMVSADAYDGLCDHVESIVRDCRDALTGEPVVGEVLRANKDKFSLAPSEADLVVVWKGRPLGLIHPRLGQVGPVPYRRTGGHTGRHGVAYFSDCDGLEHVPMMSAFDVVPTVIDMLGVDPVPGLSGRSAIAHRAHASEESVKG